MRLGFCQPDPGDAAYLTAPKSSLTVHYVINRLNWYPGNGTGILETGWVATVAGYEHVILTIAPLVGSGAGSSGQTTSPLDPTGAATPTTMTLADVAAGVWDNLFTQGFANIAAAYPTATLRIGDEWYGLNYYPWTGPPQGLAGKAAYQHLVTLARAASPTFTFEWAGGIDLSNNGGYSFADIQTFYPGDAYVDFLTGDAFDGTSGSAGKPGWDIWVNRMTQAMAFAKAHGKLYGVSSWGLYYVSQNGHGNDDDPDFIQAAYHWMKANEDDLAWALYFQNPADWLGALQSSPQSAAVFTALFGPWARQLNGDTTHRFATPGFGPVGAVKATGTFTHANGTNLHTLDVNPTAVGNVLVLSILELGITTQVSAVTGGGVSTWHKVAHSNPSAPAGDVELWYGTVTTAGPSTVTITDLNTGTNRIGCQEFTIGTPATWAVDVSATGGSTTAVTSGTYPLVTPTGRNELYVATAKFGGGGAGGATTGFVYKTGTLGFEPGSQFVYKEVASTPEAEAPAWTQASGPYAAVAALLTATPVDPNAGSHRLRLTH